MKSPIMDATIVSAYPTELTPDVLARLGAPVPASEIKTLTHGGQSIRYTEDKFVFDRLDEVVGGMNWDDDYTATPFARPLVHHKGRKDESLIVGQVVCRLTVLGVTKSAIVDQEQTDDMYGTPGTNAQARAVKRAAMKFGIARELWQKDHPGVSPSASGRSTQVSTKAPAAKSNGQAVSAPIDDGDGPKGQGFATGPQIKFLRDAFLVPPKVARELTSGNDGTTSLLINYMKQLQNGNDNFEKEAPGYLHEALLRGFTAKNRAGEDVHVQPHMHLVKFVSFPANAPDEDEDSEDDED